TQPVTRTILLESGITPAMIRTQLASGALVALRHGVVVSSGAWPSNPADQHLVRARAEVVANPHAVISHQSAAVVWDLAAPGFDAWHSAPVSLTEPGRTAHRSRSSTAVWHSGVLPPGQVTRDHEGYPVTSVARTAVDVAAPLRLPEALVVLDHAARLLVATYVSTPRRSDYGARPLVRAAREALFSATTARTIRQLHRAIPLVEPCRESGAESLSAGHLALSELPTPLFQAPIRTAAGILYPDFFWPDAMLIGEVDGAIKYTDATAFVREKEREQVLRDMGYRIVRWLAKEIMLRPSEVMLRIERALGC
ncbi:MAG TPA: DUF559 domain-containing protein, partial [Propionibacteriaceae bacterium]|nr:DUF559 domain-containing protein [Propionibacteriaceae bacterium]